MEKISQVSSSMKLMYTALAIIVVLVGFVLYSVFGAQDVMIQNTEGFLSEQSGNFGHDIEKLFYSFESDINYAAGQGAFTGLMKAQEIPNLKKNEMIRLYARHVGIIKSLNIYDENTNYTISLSNGNYFEMVKSLPATEALPYKNNKNQLLVGSTPYLIIPIYTDAGVQEANLAVGLDIDGFISEMAKIHSVGDSALKWYITSRGQFTIVNESNGTHEGIMSSGVISEFKEKLNYGFRDLIFHRATVDGVNQRVISSMYPITLGNMRYAVGFTVLESSILKEIRYKIIQIGLLFSTILILVSYIFYVFIRVEIRAKKEMASARETVSRVLQNLPTGVVIFHEIGGIIKVNGAAMRLLGLDGMTEPLTEPLDRFITAVEDEDGNLRRYIRRGMILIPIVSEITELEMNGQIVKIISFVDVSEIEQARKLAEDSSRIKSEFIANISHEIRTPMNGVLASVEILEDTRLDEEQQEFIGIIKKSATNLMVIINDILDISKIESGKMTLENIPFNLRNQLEVVTDHFAIKAQAKGVEIVMDLDPGIPEILLGDPIRLSQVINNMVGNAVKFTEEGSIAIFVSAKMRIAGKLRLSILVADTGIGIPKEKQDIIFESFTQVDGSITRKYGGTGLGTSISKELVELMKGQIWVESPNPIFGNGKGSVFHVEVDLMVPADQPEPLIVKGAPRCLLVEKSPLAAMAILKVLKAWQVEVTHVKSIKEAVNLVVNAYEHKQLYDFVLCDYETATQGGQLFEILSNIDGRGENDNSLEHVVALIDMANSEQLEKVRRYGTQYLTKPLKWKPLYEILQRE